MSAETVEIIADIEKIHQESKRIIEKWKTDGRLVIEKININGDNDVVTAADLAIEGLVRDVLGTRMRVYGEEFSTFAEADTNGLYAIVDPIDGTKEFIRDGSDWAISIAIFEGDTPLVSSLYLPHTGEHFLADAEGFQSPNQRTNARFSDTKRIAVSPRQAKNEEVIKVLTAIGYEPVEVAALTPKICSILRGDVDAAVYFPTHDKKATAAVWDYAAAPLLLKTIGGQITSCDGVDLPVDLSRINHLDGWVATRNTTDHAKLLRKLGNLTLQ